MMIALIVLAVMLVVMTMLMLFVLYQYNKLWDSINYLAKCVREMDK